MITLTTDGCPWMSEAIFHGSAVSHQVTTMRGRSGKVHRSHPPKRDGSGEDDRSVLCFEDLGLIDCGKRRGQKKTQDLEGETCQHRFHHLMNLICFYVEEDRITGSHISEHDIL